MNIIKKKQCLNSDGYLTLLDSQENLSILRVVLIRCNRKVPPCHKKATLNHHKCIRSDHQQGKRKLDEKLSVPPNLNALKKLKITLEKCDNKAALGCRKTRLQEKIQKGAKQHPESSLGVLSNNSTDNLSKLVDWKQIQNSLVKLVRCDGKVLPSSNKETDVSASKDQMEIKKHPQNKANTSKHRHNRNRPSKRELGMRDHQEQRASDDQKRLKKLRVTLERCDDKASVAHRSKTRLQKKLCKGAEKCLDYHSVVPPNKPTEYQSFKSWLDGNTKHVGRVSQM